MATINSTTNLISHISVWASPHDAPLDLVDVMPWQNVGDHINSPNPNDDPEKNEEIEELNP